MKLISTSAFKSWLPVVALSFSGFIFLTTELLPIGLLPDIAGDFQKTETVTGLLITVYAWMVSLTSLPLTLLGAKLDRRQLSLAILAAFSLCHIMAALATNFTTLMIARIGIALCHAVFWSITPPMAIRAAPPGQKHRALVVLFAGTSLATVLGVPLGAKLGHAVGWRVAFLLIGAAAMVVFMIIRRLVPPMPSCNTGSLASLPLLAKRPKLLVVYALTLLIVCAHFTTFTYLTPFLEQIGGLTRGRVEFLFMVLGAAGILGSFLISSLNARRPTAALLIPLSFMALGLGCLAAGNISFFNLIILCAVWGGAMSASGLVLQTTVLSLASDATDVAISIYSSIFNIGIGGGALIGGQILQHSGLVNVSLGGALLAGAALILGVFAVASFKFKPCR